MTGALPAPDELMELGGGADLSPWMSDPALDPSIMQGALPAPSALSPETRKILMEQIQRLSKPAERKRSMWTDPAFLAGMTLLGGGKMDKAAMMAAQAQGRQDQTAELGDTRRATALASLTGQLSRGDQMAAAANAKAAGAQQKALTGALSLVAPTQRGVLYKAITENKLDPANLGAVYDFIGQNGLKLAPNLKSVAGVGLVDVGGEAPQVVVPVQHAPNAPPASIVEYETARKQGFKGTLLEYEQAKAAATRKDPAGSQEARDDAILFAPDADPSKPEYQAAHYRRTQARPMQIPDKDGNPVWQQVTPVLPPNVRAPVIPQGGQPAGAAPSAGPAPAPGSPAPSLSMQPMAPPAADKTAKAKMDVIITEASTLSNALDDYVDAVAKAGPGERALSVAGVSTPSNTAYNNAALLAKGEQLYNLGVLNGPDLAILQKTLADPSTFKGQAAGPEAAKAAADSVRRLIQDRVNLMRKQQGLAPLDIQKQGKSVRGKSDASTSNTFTGMPSADLARVDISKLSAAELEAFIEATK